MKITFSSLIMGYKFIFVGKVMVLKVQPYTARICDLNSIQSHKKIIVGEVILHHLSFQLQLELRGTNKMLLAVSREDNINSGRSHKYLFKTL